MICIYTYINKYSIHTDNSNNINDGMVYVTVRNQSLAHPNNLPLQQTSPYNPGSNNQNGLSSNNDGIALQTNNGMFYFQLSLCFNVIRISNKNTHFHFDD